MSLPSSQTKRRRQAAPKNKIQSCNIVCLLPAEDITKPITIPGAKRRAQLSEAGLIGKIAVNLDWGDDDVKHEISSTFASSFFLEDEKKSLAFDYLRYR